MSKSLPVIEYKFDRRVKTTKNQTKKHVSQFTSQEHFILSTLISTIDAKQVNITNHAKNHIPFLSRSIIAQTIAAFDVIEFNITNESPRVLIRSKKQLNIIAEQGYERANVCIVISISDMSVVTAYLNCIGDSHDTLDMNRYDSTIDIVKHAMCN